MINKLTKAQEEAIIPFREKWIDRILRTEQTDDEIKNNIKGIYRLAGLKEPKDVWIMDSMFGVQVALNFIKNSKKDDLKNIRSNIWSNIGSNIWSNIESNIESNIRSNIESNIWSNIGSNIWSNIESNIRSNIESNIWSNIESNIRSNIESNIESNIWSNIRSNIESNIESNIWSNIWSNIESNIESNKLEFFGFSSNEATYLQWYIYPKYYFDNGLLLPDKYSELLNSYIEMAIDAWAVYYSPNIAIVSRKPEIKRNNEGRLHSLNSPAVLFKDGYEIHYINGIYFPKEMFEKLTKHEMSFEEILAIVDVDQRNQAMRFVGDKEREKFLKHVKAEVIDEYVKESINGNKVFYKLYHIPKNDIFTTDVKAMWYTCPSTGMSNFSGVPSDMTTVAGSMAWKGSDDKYIINPKDWERMIPLVDEA